MKTILAIVAITCTVVLNVHGGLIFTTFSIPAGSSNVGFFSINSSALNDLERLSEPGSTTRAYAYRFFTPSVTGLYTIGMTDADYDPVMILYSGQTSFPELSPGTGAFAINDDGDWDEGGGSYFFGTQTVNPSAAAGEPGWMPLIKDQNLTAGMNYLVAISTYNDSITPLTLPAEFFVAGGGAVTLDGATAAVPEPGTWAAAALLAGGAAFMRWRKRRDEAQRMEAA